MSSISLTLFRFADRFVSRSADLPYSVSLFSAQRSGRCGGLHLLVGTTTNLHHVHTLALKPRTSGPVMFLLGFSRWISCFSWWSIWSSDCSKCRQRKVKSDTTTKTEKQKRTKQLIHTQSKKKLQKRFPCPTFFQSCAPKTSKDSSSLKPLWSIGNISLKKRLSQCLPICPFKHIFDAYPMLFRGLVSLVVRGFHVHPSKPPRWKSAEFNFTISTWGGVSDRTYLISVNLGSHFLKPCAKHK